MKIVVYFFVLAGLSGVVGAEEVAVSTPPPERLGDAIKLSEDAVLQFTEDGRAQPAARSAASVPVSGFTIDQSNRNAVCAGYHYYYQASEGFEAVMNWTGNVSTCMEGTVSSEFQDKSLRRINYFRAQAGVPADIYFDASKNADSQKAALIMARQGALSHDPNDDFPGNPCLSAGGDAAAGAGNISLGRYGSRSIDGLMIDSGSNNTVVGHRRWLLYLRAREMGNGSIPPNGSFPYTLPEHYAANCVWVIGNFKPAPAAQAVPWPNEGYVPWQMVPDDGDAPARWSYSYPGANFSGASVTMVQGATPVSLSLETVSTGAGDNTVVWKPVGIPNAAPAADTPYTVTVSGITGAPFSSATYTVTVIDPFQVNDPPVITGTASPAAGVDNPYSFSAVDQAENYEVSIAEAFSGSWLEGAESSPAPRVVDGTDAGYNLISTYAKKTGAYGFHLATPGFGAGDHFAVDRDLVPQAGSTIDFSYQRFFMHPDTKLRVELSLDGGSSYGVIHSIDGQAAGGSSTEWDDNFIDASVPVPAAYQGKQVRMRFRLHPTGSTYVGTSNSNGLHIDDVSMTSAIELGSPTTLSLPGSATGFDFNPSVAGQQTYLQVAPELGGHVFPYGPVKIVTSVTGGTPPVITSASSANGAQGEVFSFDVTASQSPTGFGATGLPAGAMINSSTGEITGQIAPGIHTGIMVSASNAYGTGSAPLTIQVLTGYEQAVLDSYPGLGAPAEDDDSDSVANIVELAIAGMHPLVDDAHLLPGVDRSSISSGYFYYTIPKSGLPGLDYTVEGAPNLEAGTLFSVAGISTSVDTSTELTVRIPLSYAGRYHLRARVTQNNDTTE